jgi:hypothetical protein
MSHSPASGEQPPAGAGLTAHDLTAPDLTAALLTATRRRPGAAGRHGTGRGCRPASRARGISQAGTPGAADMARCRQDGHRCSSSRRWDRAGEYDRQSPCLLPGAAVLLLDVASISLRAHAI